MPMQVVYSWTHPTDRAGARRIVAAMREAALKLPFVRVSEIIDEEWGDEQTRDPERRKKRRKKMSDADLERHFIRWPGRWFVKNDDDHEVDGELIEPTWTCYFTAELNGCDPVIAALASHVSHVNVKREWGGYSEASTKLEGLMAWQCRVETLNASMPQHGGWANFLKQHTTVLKFLGTVEKLGPTLDVWDQDGYWETTSEDLLRKDLERSGAITAHSFGAMKDAMEHGDELGDVLPFLKHPLFEQLEAKGEQIANEDTPGKHWMREGEEQMREEPWQEHHRRLREEE
ncbi:MAG: hypothetical protein IPK87_02405 [Planctomycetes bacterium]|nr:hypothetical protein [Planctomycetota bacterium]